MDNQDFRECTPPRPLLWTTAVNPGNFLNRNSIIGPFLYFLTAPLANRKATDVLETLP